MTVKEYAESLGKYANVYRDANGEEYLLVQKVMTPGADLFMKMSAEMPAPILGGSLAEMEKI